MNRTLVECARCMLELAKMSRSYWGAAVTTAMFLRNRCPSRATTSDKSSFEVWSGKSPLLANLNVFGCHAYVHVPSAKRLKLDARSTRCRCLGYSEHEKAYRFEDVASGRVFVSRDAKFMEDVFDDGQRHGGATTKQADIGIIDDNTDEEDSQHDDSDEDMDGENEEQEGESTAPQEGSLEHISGIKRHTRSQSLEDVTETHDRSALVESVERVVRLQVPRRPIDQRLSTTCLRSMLLTSCIQWESCRRRSSRRWNPATRASGVKRATRSTSH